MTARFSRNVIFEPKELAEAVKFFRKQGAFTYDLETKGVYRGVPSQNEVVWLSMATYGRTLVVPMGHPNGNVMVEKPRRRKDPVTKSFVMTPARWDDPPKQMRPSQAFEALEPLMFDESVEKSGWGFLFDILSTAKYYDGKPPVGPYHDGIIQSWLLNENQRLGLKDITKKRYKRDYDAEHVGRKVEIHPFNKVARYAYMDARYTWMHIQDNLLDIEAEGLTEIYDLERKVFEVLIQMGLEGQPVDIDEMLALDETLSERRIRSMGEVYRAAGKEFNLNSPKQKVDILYGEKSEGGQGLKPWRLTKGGLKKQEDGHKVTLYDYSTDAEALEKFPKNKVVKNLLEYQEVDRVLGTYIKGYLGNPENDKSPTKIFDHKVYPDFVQYGTVTGRFSCRTPNLQNIPRPDSDLGKAVRGLFVAGEGHKLIVADYGQIELVVLAHFVGKGALYQGFFEGIDPHTMTAALVFGQDPNDLQKRVDDGDSEAKGMRQAAKAINFAVVYGAGPAKVASMAGVTETRAKSILKTHEHQFPEIYEFKDQALKVCRSRKPPHLVTLLGRKRRVPSIMSRDGKTRSKAERQAINSLIQGSAADLIKVAMIRADEQIRADNTGRLLLTVHDELVVRVPEDKAATGSALIREAMLGDGIQKLVDVPLSIDLKVVDRWSEAK